MSSTEGHHLVKIKLGKRSAGSQASRVGSCIFMYLSSLPTAPPACCQPADRPGSPGGSGAWGTWFPNCPPLPGNGCWWGGSSPAFMDCKSISLHSPPVRFLHTLQLWGSPKVPSKLLSVAFKALGERRWPPSVAPPWTLGRNHTERLFLPCPHLQTHSHLQTLLHDCASAPCGPCL